ncbi:hypothetical protein [Sphingobacterium sp. IITKGP-BTPF85]|uniref:hypothetical protein n=1 Tax=Sphingobacterium sp. IITKGP-BTPF85 TaxID=1338009 RepID=UPI00038A1D6F|nr:hypothetical protein [Sphingobacterium sp. IITKGP-BTPF85]KKX47455.1 hypothetical protein L950_0226445 [Sphingobacterium sp. IITKGP-BTPF85]
MFDEERTIKLDQFRKENNMTDNGLKLMVDFHRNDFKADKNGGKAFQLIIVFAAIAWAPFQDLFKTPIVAIESILFQLLKSILWTSVILLAYRLFVEVKKLFNRDDAISKKVIMCYNEILMESENKNGM